MEENILNNEVTTKTEPNSNDKANKQETVKQPKTNNSNSKDEAEMTLEEQIAQLKVDKARYKRAIDKATSEAANFKRQLREKQSADEIAAQEKAEREAKREEQFKALVRENTVNKYAKSFLALGYTEDMAEKAAEAQYDGDTDTLFDIQKKMRDDYAKTIKEELMKSMPVSHISNDSEVSITQEQFNKLSYREQVEFKNKYPELWKRFA